MSSLRSRLLSVAVACLAGIAVTPALAAPAASAASTPACRNATAMPTAGNLGAIGDATLCLVNRQRARHHLKPLKAQRTLSAVARRFAGLLVAGRFFDHSTPSGTTMVDRIKRSTYLSSPLTSWSLGENIAYGTGVLATPKAIVKAWMNSPGHRANILEPRFREIGLGVAMGSPDGSAGGATYVHDFGVRVR
jgi:uncharacterized protein YkwD